MVHFSQELMKIFSRTSPILLVRRLPKVLHHFPASCSLRERPCRLQLLPLHPPTLGLPDADLYQPSKLEPASTRDQAVLMVKAANSLTSRLACSLRHCLLSQETSQIDTSGEQVNSSAEMAKLELGNYFLPHQQSHRPPTPSTRSSRPCPQKVASIILARFEHDFKAEPECTNWWICSYKSIRQS
jgi:hypothetical protein